MRKEIEIKEKLEELKEDYGFYDGCEKMNVQARGNIEALEWVLEMLEYLD